MRYNQIVCWECGKHIDSKKGLRDPKTGKVICPDCFKEKYSPKEENKQFIPQ
jgi:NMD protein affecting ribosome stability and mRNA decay